MDTNQVRNRLRHAIVESKRIATERRERTVFAEREGTRVLMDIVAPVFKVLVGALKGEGYSFQVSTPPSAVRMTASATPDDFIELAFDATCKPPALIGRVSHVRGRRVLVSEKVAWKDTAFTDVTEDGVLDFLLVELSPFIER